MFTISSFQMLLLLISLIVLGILHTLTLIENNKLQRSVSEEEYIPFRNIYIRASNGTTHINKLIKTNLDVFEQNDIQVVQRHSQDGVTLIEYETGSQIIIVDYNTACLNSFPHDTKDQYNYHIFFDNELPDSAIRATIQDLGLEGYMIGVGICTERSVKNGEKD